jgi:hypothetical protein
LKKFAFILMLVFVVVVSCENTTNEKVEIDNDNVIEDDSKETPDESEEVEETPDEEGADEDDYNPENPGYTVEFFFLDIAMMGEPSSMIIGYVMETAREDLKEEAEVVSQPINTCVMGESAPRVPECHSDADCAPEQRCLPEERDGQPIENSERCVTPDRDSLDVGPIVISGFAAGPQTFLYEQGDQVYKLNGQGDGSVDPSLVTYSTDYQLYAENPTPENLDPFSGEFYLGARLELTSHAVVQGDMMPAIELKLNEPMTFTWTPSGMYGTVELTINAMANFNTVSISCLVEDNGEFTIPHELASQLVFGEGMMDMMGNMLTITRNSEAYISGDSISSGKIGSEQILLVNIKPVF